MSERIASRRGDVPQQCAIPRSVVRKLLTAALNSTVSTRCTADAVDEMRHALDDVAVEERRAYFDRFE